jgi:hypothetical protein
VIDALKKHWRDLASGRPGHRFQDHYRRAHKGALGFRRVCKMAAAIVLTIAGLVLLFIPGPGSVLIVIGAALLAQESEVIARLCDASEVRGRKLISAAVKAWRGSSMVGRSSLVVAVVALAGSGAWFVYSRFIA